MRRHTLYNRIAFVAAIQFGDCLAGPRVDVSAGMALRDAGRSAQPDRPYRLGRV